VLVLNLLRWESDIRDFADLDIPKEGVKAAGVDTRELAMATQLIDSMSAEFDPAQFTDRFSEQVMELVARRAKAGKTHTVSEPEEDLPQGSADIIDLTELLKRSLKDGKPRESAARRRSRAA
jgi:DNA end-binding protein Ku